MGEDIKIGEGFVIFEDYEWRILLYNSGLGLDKPNQVYLTISYKPEGIKWRYNLIKAGQEAIDAIVKIDRSEWWRE